MASSNTTSKINDFIDGKYIPLDPKIKIAIAVVALIVPVALFYFLSYEPTTKKINNLTQQKQKLIAEISKAKKAAAELDTIKEDIKETEQLFKETASLLPKSKEIPALLRNISDLGKRSGLEFLSFKPGKETPKEFYAEIPVNIIISGPYHNVGYFLDQVSKLERIVSVKNIKMTNPKKEGPEMVLKSSCQLTTYRFTGIEAKDKSAEKKGKKKKSRKKKR